MQASTHSVQTAFNHYLAESQHKHTHKLSCDARRKLSWLPLLFAPCLAVWMVYHIKQMQEDYNEAEGRGRVYAAALEDSDSAVIMLNEDGLVVSWNKGATRMFGYDAPTMLQQNILRLMPPEVAGKHREAFAKAVSRGSMHAPVQVMNCAIRTASGEEQCVHIVVRSVTYDDSLRFIAVIDPADKVMTTGVPINNVAPQATRK